MLAFLGGTGPEGRGLALRFAMAGEATIIGSRDAVRAATAAEELGKLAPGTSIEGLTNGDAARLADVVFLTFPYEGQRPVLEQLGGVLEGKLVVNVIAPMTFQRGAGSQRHRSRGWLGGDRSAGAIARLAGCRGLPNGQRRRTPGAAIFPRGRCYCLL